MATTTAQSSRTDDAELVQYLRDLFIAARDSKRELYDTWQRNYRLVKNRYTSTPTNSWAPQPKDSEIYPHIAALVAWLTDQQVRMEMTPAADPGSEFFTFINKVCNDLQAIVSSNWRVENYDAQVKIAVWDALMYSVGITKACWDQSKAGGLGNALIKRVDPWKFYPDPNATSLDDAEYMIEVHKLSLAEIERRWPSSSLVAEAGSVLDDDSPDNSDSTGYVRMANPGFLTGGNRLPSGRASDRPTRSGRTTDLHTVYECWIKDNERVEDDGELEYHSCWRCIIMCNGQILLNEKAEDLWSYASHPYARFCFDDIGEFYGISLVDHMASPQIYINRLLTAFQHNVELSGNPVLVESANSGTSRVGIVNKPGQRLELKGATGMAQKPDWLVPPPMNANVLNLIQFWISRMESISGLSAIVRGATPTARNAEGVISAVQEAAFVRIRSALRNLESMLNDVVYKVADLMVDNYNEKRYVSVIGPAGKQTAAVLRPNHFMVPGKKGMVPLQYALNIGAGSTFPTSRQARIAEADKLFTLGAIDDQALLEAHQYPNIQEVIDRKNQKMAMGMAQVPGARAKAGH